VDDKEKLREVRRLAQILAPYGGHKEDCSSRLDDCNPASDYCDCNLNAARAAYVRIIEITGV
jgi:hypothetical protein